MRATDVVRFRINAGGAEVFFGGHWIPADERILANITMLMKEGLPDRPDLAAR